MYEKVCTKCKKVILSEHRLNTCPSCGINSFFLMNSSDIGCAMYFEQTGESMEDYERINA